MATLSPTFSSKSALAPKAPGRTFLSLLAVWQERRALARLDADRLADLGLTRAEVEAECARTLWDAPSHWLR